MCSRDAVDRESGARRRETPRLPAQSGCWTTGTGWAFVDAGRLTHNPEVGGSNPPPATNFRRSRRFPSRERAFGVAEHVTRARGLGGAPRPRQVRRAGTPPDSMKRGGRSRVRSLGASPRSSTGIYPSLMPSILNRQSKHTHRSARLRGPWVREPGRRAVHTGVRRGRGHRGQRPPAPLRPGPARSSSAAVTSWPATGYARRDGGGLSPAVDARR